MKQHAKKNERKRGAVARSCMGEGGGLGQTVNAAHIGNTEVMHRPLKLRERQFVDALFRTTPPMNGAEAARMVGVSVASCRVQASKWLTKSNIRAEIEKRRQELEKQSLVTREQWLKKMEHFFRADVRKMFDQFGNPIEIPQLGDDEAVLVEGFEFCEDFTKVKKGSGETDAVATGYTKRIKLTPRIKALLEFGKVMGFYTEKQTIEHTFSLEDLVLGSMDVDE